MRLFLAVDLPAKTKEELSRQLQDLKREYTHFNWVSQENFHTTLVFLGERQDDDIDLIKKKVEEAIFDINPFELYSLGAGLFLTNKLVLYILLRREKALEEIAAKIKYNLQLEDDKKYVPHISIARTRVPSKQQYLHLKKKLHKLEIDIDFPVNKIHLFQSILTGKKPEYKKIASFSLAK